MSRSVAVILLRANIAALLEFTVGILISKLFSQEITAIVMPILGCVFIYANFSTDFFN